MMKKLLIICFLALCLFSCENNDDNQPQTFPETLIGVWHNGTMKEPDASAFIYWKTSALQAESGFTFKANGEFVERKNAGWCGTPPIAYNDFMGKWTLSPDSVLKITVGFWGGTQYYQWKILSMTAENLCVLPLTNVAVYETEFCYFTEEQEFNPVLEIVNNYLKTIPAELTDEAKINLLKNWLQERDCVKEVEILCVSCIKTLPEQSELRIVFDVKGSDVEKTMDVAMGNPLTASFHLDN